ncbi:MAG: hypothetical protein HQ595_00825 [Candidatus Omnitrophica bacterium]|nr:hypothetical protein [Candidatus Omnitrophota bacterium]
MAECKQEKNTQLCNCSYDPCSRKGICCECLHYHRQQGELPACFFPADAEKTYNRSIEQFIKAHKE